DFRLVLDQELSRLPAKYQVPIVLCDVEGRTRKQAACEIGCPEGTLSTRLATARRMLAKRLTRRGLALSAGLLGAILSENAGNAVVQHSLVAATVQAARVITGKGIAGYTISAHVAALTKGVLKSMVVSKLKTTALGLGAFGALALGLCTGIAMPRSQTAQ